MLSELFLKVSRERISEPCKHLPRSGKCKNVVADLIAALVPLDSESFFSALCVFFQCAVTEPKPLGFFGIIINHIDDTARIQGKEPEMAHQHRHFCSHPYLHGRPPSPETRLCIQLSPGQSDYAKCPASRRGTR